MSHRSTGRREILTKIGYLVPEFPGQTHIFFWRELNELKKLGVTPVLISTKRPDRKIISHDWSEAAMAETTYLFPLGTMTFLRSAMTLIAMWPSRQRGIFAMIFREAEKASRLRLLLLLPFAAALVRFCRQQGIRHIHVHSCTNAAAVVMLAKAIDDSLTYGLTLHGPLSDYGPNQSLKWGHADYGVVITAKLLDEVRRRLGADVAGKCLIAPMGVNIDVFTRQEPYQPWARGSGIRLFSCGRLNYIKGHQDLIRAVALLVKKRGFDIHLSIAGEDEIGGQGFRKVLEEKIKQEGLAGQVTLIGAVSEKKIREELEACHVFALASHGEPLGVAYMEAMAMAVPVVGTKGGGVSELIDDGVDGILATPKSAEDIASRVEFILDHPEFAIEMGLKARQKIVERFQASGSAETLYRMVIRA